MLQITHFCAINYAYLFYPAHLTRFVLLPHLLNYCLIELLEDIIFYMYLGYVDKHFIFFYHINHATNYHTSQTLQIP